MKSTRRRRGREVEKRIFEMYSQNLQIAQRSESSIFDAADVVAVQLPAPQTHVSGTRKNANAHAHVRTEIREREREGEREKGRESGVK